MSASSVTDVKKRREVIYVVAGNVTGISALFLLQTDQSSLRRLLDFSKNYASNGYSETFDDHKQHIVVAQNKDDLIIMSTRFWGEASNPEMGETSCVFIYIEEGSRHTLISQALLPHRNCTCHVIG